jgi:tetrahydromethanopterin S-methyltransferase subunit F
MVMSDWGFGYVSGIFVGLVIGLLVGRKREPWSELTDRQRKITIGLIAAGVVLLAAGIVVFFIVSG